MTDEQIIRYYEKEGRRQERFRADPEYAERRRAQWRQSTGRYKQRLRQMRGD